MIARGAWLPAAVLAATVAGLVAAVAIPGVDQFEGKGWSVRLVAYPLLMLVAPATWWLLSGRRTGEPRPHVAFALIMLPFLADTTGNWLDLFRRVTWWDDVSHAAHWFLLSAGIALLVVPHVRPRWVVVPLVTGVGALLAVGWELGEYWLFIRDGTEAAGAHRDTLGDEALGTSGALTAALLVVGWRRSREHTTDPGRGGPTYPREV